MRADLVGLGKVVDDLFARQVCWQCWPTTASAGVGRDFDFGLLYIILNRFLGFIVQAELGTGCLFAGAGECLALERADDLFELADARVARFKQPFLLADLTLEGGNLIRLRGGLTRSVLGRRLH